LAVVKALPNVVLAAITGGLAAAQIAVIASQKPPNFKQGGDFVVPRGYENDTFRMNVSSGEHVSVTPAGKLSSGPTVVINFNTPVPHGEWIKKSVEEGLRKTGLTASNYFVNNAHNISLVN
jgi:hypothetical protein